MKFVSLRDGTRDGRLAMVSRDLTRVAYAETVARNMQDLLDRWDRAVPYARRLAKALENDRIENDRIEQSFAFDPAETLSPFAFDPDETLSPFAFGPAETLSPFAFDPAQTLSPLPRAWQWLDGSAFLSHDSLMRKVFKLNGLPQFSPLMYQGRSDRFIAPMDEVPFPSEADGIDFEGEFGVIVSETRMGATSEEAASRIRLIVLINDWSLRELAPIEMKTGFGWVQAKPACSMAPVAVTPDELGPYWLSGRVGLPLLVQLNGVLFGQPNGQAMHFSFGELAAHAAHTRTLCGGTVIGAGAVSNSDPENVGSCCIAERRALEMLHFGNPKTPYLHFGDRVRMECLMPNGLSVFGAIDQIVVPGR